MSAVDMLHRKPDLGEQILLVTKDDAIAHVLEGRIKPLG